MKNLFVTLLPIGRGLFLCSRCFKTGDDVYVKSEGVSQKSQQQLVGKGIVEKITASHVEVRIAGEVLPFSYGELFKIIGKIAPEVTFIKAGDEFNVEILGRR